MQVYVEPASHTHVVDHLLSLVCVVLYIQYVSNMCAAYGWVVVVYVCMDRAETVLICSISY